MPVWAIVIALSLFSAVAVAAVRKTTVAQKPKRATPKRMVQVLSGPLISAKGIEQLGRLMRGESALGYVAKTKFGAQIVSTQAEAAKLEQLEAYRRAQDLANLLERYKPRGKIDVVRARDLAFKVHSHVTETLGFYSPELIAVFKEAAGLRRPDGTVDGRYDGSVIGALQAYTRLGYDKIEVAIHAPYDVIPYPESIAGA